MKKQNEKNSAELKTMSATTSGQRAISIGQNYREMAHASWGAVIQAAGVTAGR